MGDDKKKVVIKAIITVVRLIRIWIIHRSSVHILNPPLREIGRKDVHPKKEIEEGIKGVEFDYFYTGKRTGTSGQIEPFLNIILRFLLLKNHKFIQQTIIQ